MSDECRVEMIDGEPVLVRGSGPMSDEARAAFAEIVRAARAEMDRRPPRPCRSPRCDVDEAHTHGPSCSARCLCGMGES